MLNTLFIFSISVAALTSALPNTYVKPMNTTTVNHVKFGDCTCCGTWDPDLCCYGGDRNQTDCNSDQGQDGCIWVPGSFYGPFQESRCTFSKSTTFCYIQETESECNKHAGDPDGCAWVDGTPHWWISKRGYCNFTGSSMEQPPANTKVGPPCHFINRYNKYICSETNDTQSCRMGWERPGNCNDAGYTVCCHSPLYSNDKYYFKTGLKCSSGIVPPGTQPFEPCNTTANIPDQGRQ